MNYDFQKKPLFDQPSGGGWNLDPVVSILNKKRSIIRQINHTKVRGTLPSRDSCI